MVVQTEQKRDEHCPLLPMDGGGDIPQPPPPTISPGWKVACIPKRSWLDRCPEYISACWMTFILLGITFIVFYTLGMSAYRRKSIVYVNCNTTKPENNVFFHHVLPRGSNLRFTLYSDYLSNMAIEYPFLHINVFFLVDDSLHNSVYGVKHSSAFKRFGSSFNNNVYPVSVNENEKQEIQILQQRYRNINITIMSLSQYMAMTPMKYKWNMIPIFYLPFYARVFAVWEYGGIGLDLITFNNQYNIHQNIDRRISAVLKQHNDGIEEKKYIQALNTIDHEEESEIFNIFYNLLTNILNNTFTFFDNTLFSPPMATEKNPFVVTVSRNYRNRLANDKILLNNSANSLKGNPPYIINETNVRSLLDNDLYYTVNFASKNLTDDKNKKLPISNVQKNFTYGDQSKKNVDGQKFPLKIFNMWESNLHDIIMNANNNNTKQHNKTIIALPNYDFFKGSVKVNQVADIEKNVTKSAPLIKDELVEMWKSDPSQNVKSLWKNLLSTTKSKDSKTANVKSKTKKENNEDTSKMQAIKATTEIPHVVLLYDFSIFTDGIGPSYFLPDMQPNLSFEKQVIREPVRKINKPPYLLSITSDGNFIAATSRHHPFLSHLLSSGCKRVNPRFAIEDTVFSQCSGFLRNDVYCDNIYILD